MGIIERVYLLYLLGNLRPWNCAENLPSPTISHISESGLGFQDECPSGCGRNDPVITCHSYDHGDWVWENGTNLFQRSQAMTWTWTTNIWKVLELYVVFLFFQHPFLFPIALLASFVFSVCANISFFLCTLFHPNPIVEEAESSDSGR